MKALVTGAGGFIGGALARSLSDSGWDVDVLVRQSGRSRLEQEGFYIVQADLGELTPDLACQMRAYDVVFHAAAIRDRWGTSMERYRQVNVEGTRRLLDAVRGRTRRFVYISSVGVFGHPGVTRIDEGFPVDPGAGKQGYHTTKVEAERVARERADEFEVVVVRPTITYGPGDEDGMLTRLIELIDQGRFMQVGSGRNHFHLIYIDDLVAGLKTAAVTPRAVGENFILAGPRSIEVRELIQLASQVLGKPTARLAIPEFAARGAAWGLEMVYHLGAALGISSFRSTPFITRDKIDTVTVHRGFSYEKAAYLLGFQPKVDYEEGLVKTIEWMVSCGKHPALQAVENRLQRRSEVRR